MNKKVRKSSRKANQIRNTYHMRNLDSTVEDMQKRLKKAHRSNKEHYGK